MRKEAVQAISRGGAVLGILLLTIILVFFLNRELSEEAEEETPLPEGECKEDKDCPVLFLCKDGACISLAQEQGKSRIQAGREGQDREAPGVPETAEEGVPGFTPGLPEEDNRSEDDGAIEEAVPEEPDEAAESISDENTPALCSNGTDDDGDGAADNRDRGCVGVSCGDGGGVWSWSYLRAGSGEFIEDASQPPQRIGCVGINNCVNIRGEEVSRGVFYSEQWICGQSNDFYRCTEADLGARSGSFECRLEDGTYRWTDTAIAEAEPIPVENTPELCSDGLDNDEDGRSDGMDWNCMGLSCPRGGQWTWSYLRTGPGGFMEPTNRAPARIGCVSPDQCVNLAGEAVDRYAFYTNKWICGDDNDFYRCELEMDEDSFVGQRISGLTLGYICIEDEGVHRWASTT